MRVLHVIPSVDERSGGPATAIVPMCRALMAHGIEVLIVTTDAGSEQEGVGKPAFVRSYKDVPTMLFPSQLGESFKYSRPLATWLNSNIRNFGLAHIHAVFNHSSVAAAHSCRKAGVPYVVRPLGTLDPWSMAQKSLRKKVFWQVSGKGMLRRAAAVHYTSEPEKRATEELFGLNHGKVVPLGVDGDTSTPLGKGEFAKYFPALVSDPYVLVMSRLHPKKGLDVLLDAFLCLLDDRRYARWRLVIAGDGPSDYVSKLKSKVESSSQRERILFTGWMEGEKKAALLGGASLLVLPSYQENFGLCVMEAMCNSVPVLVSPHVNLADEIDSAGAGWVTPVEKNALAAKLAHALEDDWELEQRGRAAKDLSRKYSWEAAARGLIGLYEEILKKSTDYADYTDCFSKSA